VCSIVECFIYLKNPSNKKPFPKASWGALYQSHTHNTHTTHGYGEKKSLLKVQFCGIIRNEPDVSFEVVKVKCVKAQKKEKKGNGNFWDIITLEMRKVFLFLTLSSCGVITLDKISLIER
jgi:hypothetical protein